MDDYSPSRGIIIVLSAGLSGVVVVLIAAAVIVISVTVCLRKRNNKHINITDHVAYGTSRNKIELSACDDVANQPSSGQLKMKNNTEMKSTLKVRNPHAVFMTCRCIYVHKQTFTNIITVKYN